MNENNWKIPMNRPKALKGVAVAAGILLGASPAAVFAAEQVDEPAEVEVIDQVETLDLEEPETLAENDEETVPDSEQAIMAASEEETEDENDADGQEELEAGVQISENTDFAQSDAHYQVQFTYEAAQDVTKVQLIGGFGFYTLDQVEDYVAGNEFNYTLPYEYKEGMFPTGYNVAEMAYVTIDMDNVGKNIWSVSVPLPGYEYFYGYQITDSEGNTTIVKDPTNLPLANGDSDSGWSLLYVGNAEDTLPGQELIYERTDGKVGTVEFVEYTAVDGTTQPLGIYLPYGYDATQTYKTLYLSHGGGGNEVEWFYIGSAKNILDNLIAEGELEPTIVVTMDNTYFNFEKGDSVKNILEAIIPYVEANYSVSKEADDRALAGLSSGATVTVQTVLENNDAFGYYGIWSPSRTLDFVNETLTDEQKASFSNALQYYVSVGVFDSFVRRDVNVQVYEDLKDAGANVVFTWQNGAHDWGVWRAQLSDFAQNYLWKSERAQETPSPETPTPQTPAPETPSEAVTPDETEKSEENTASKEEQTSSAAVAASVSGTVNTAAATHAAGFVGLLSAALAGAFVALKGMKKED